MARSMWRRIAKDLKNREYIDAYSLAFVAFGLAIFSLVPDLVPNALKWAVPRRSRPPCVADYHPGHLRGNCRRVAER